MPLSPELVRVLERHGHEATHATEAGLSRASDDEILRHARDGRCVVVTADLDFARLLALAGADAPGLILFRGGNYNQEESARMLVDLLNTLPPEELAVSLVIIEKNRIRRRRLPIHPVMRG